MKLQSKRINMIIIMNSSFIISIGERERKYCFRLIKYNENERMFSSSSSSSCENWNALLCFLFFFIVFFVYCWAWQMNLAQFLCWIALVTSERCLKTRILLLLLVSCDCPCLYSRKNKWIEILTMLYVAEVICWSGYDQ